MLRLLIIALLALVPIGWAAPSFAQSAVPIVVSSCGTPIYTLTASQNANPTMDTTGNLCTSGSGGGGGNVTITGPLGRSADASSVSMALSTEDVAIFTTVNGTTNTQTHTCSTAAFTLLSCLGQVDDDVKGGTGTIGSTFPVGGVAFMGQASSAEPSKTTTSDSVSGFYDLTGKIVTSPYSNRENQARGTASETGTSAGTIMAASGSASLKEYVTDLTCGNSSSTFDWVTINDSASSVFPNPPTGGFSAHFTTPLVAAANTAVTFTATTGETTEKCSAAGYYGY